MKSKRLKLSLFVILIGASLFASQEIPIVKLTPPLITTNTISQTYACMRPTRDTGFNISLQQDEPSQLIVNCYGHGGSGWSTLFGSVYKALGLFEMTCPSKDEPIRVIGSGCMGLTAAIELTRAGYKVSGITTESIYDLASWRAAGFLGLLATNTTPEGMNELYNLASQTFLVYQQIENGKHPYLNKEGVKLLPIYCTPDTAEELAFLSERGLTPPKKPVTLDFGNGVVHPGFFEYQTFFMNTSRLMLQLINEVKKLGISIEINHLHAFSTIKERVIFNCTGAGSKEINHDSKITPVRGHLITLNDHSGSGHMNYMMSANVEQNGILQPVYMTPKDLLVTSEHPEGVHCLGVIGVTFIPHAEELSPEQLKTLDANEYQKLLERASLFFSGHS